MRNSIITFVLLATLLSSCAPDTGKIQADLQRIYMAINDEEFAQANEKLVGANQLSQSPLQSSGYVKELYGQVNILETYPIGDDAEMIIYRLETHERHRQMQRRMKSEEFQERQRSGQVISVDEEKGITVFTLRKLAFRVKGADGEYRYIIQPTNEALQAHFSNKMGKVQQLIDKHYREG